MSCKCAKISDQYHGWECEVSGGACMFLHPNSKLCAEEYGEGTDANEPDLEDAEKFVEDDLTKYSCWDCENEFITGDRAVEQFPDRLLQCPYCGSTNVEGIVFAEAGEIDDMGCMAIMTNQ